MEGAPTLCCTGLPGAETVSPDWTESGGGGETDFRESQKERLGIDWCWAVTQKYLDHRTSALAFQGRHMFMN